MTETTFQRWDTDRNLALLGYGLLFAAVFFAGITALVAVVLAYSVRDRATTAVRPHFDSQIRIFWVGSVLILLAVAAGVVGVAALIGGVVAYNGGWEGWQDWDLGERGGGGFGVASIVLIAASAVLWVLATCGRSAPRPSASSGLPWRPSEA